MEEKERYVKLILKADDPNRSRGKEFISISDIGVVCRYIQQYIT
jgi:hypothetical protein